MNDKMSIAANPYLQSFEGIFEGFIQQVRIDLSSGNRSMSEGLLNNKDVRGACIQTGCEAVPEAMRRDSLVDPSFDNPLIESTLDLPSGDSVLYLTEEECLAFNEGLLALLQIVMQNGTHLSVQKPVNDLSAFSPDRDPLLQEVDVGNIEVDELGEPDTVVQKEIDDDQVSICLPAFLESNGLQKDAFLVFCQEDGRLSVLALDLNAYGGIVIDLISIGQPAKEAFDRSPCAIDGRGLLELTIGLFGYRIGKKETIDIGRCDIPDVAVTAKLVEQQIQISLLCSDGMWRSAVSKLVIQEQFDRLIECHDSSSGLNSSRGCQLHIDWLVMNKRTFSPMYSMIGAVILRSPTSWKFSPLSMKVTIASELSYRNDFTSAIRSSYVFSVMLSLLFLLELGFIYCQSNSAV